MIQRERLVKDFEAMAQLTAPGEGINRLAFTDADWKGRQYIIDRMILVMSLAIRLVRNQIYQLLWWGLIRIACPMEAITMVWSVCYLLLKLFVV